MRWVTPAPYGAGARLLGGEGERFGVRDRRLDDGDQRGGAVMNRGHPQTKCLGIVEPRRPRSGRSGASKSRPKREQTA